MSDPSWIDALLAPEGQRVLDAIATETIAPSTEIALITRLRRSFPAELVASALEQHKLRARAVGKFSSAATMLFTAAGLEQASSERMARHHAARYTQYARVADFCCGIGGDAIGLAAGSAVVAVDRDPVHSRLARHNASANGVADRVTVVCADVRDVSLVDIDAAFIDPARRTDDRRLAPGTSEPSLAWCFSLAEGGRGIGVKAAPGLPLELAPADWEIEFVSERRELKESVLWSPALRTTGRRATLLPHGETMVGDASVRSRIAEPGGFLLDPDPAVTRAGLVGELAASLAGCWQIDDRVAFLSSDEPVETPFARTLAIEASMPWGLSGLREYLRTAGIGTIDIRKRGSAVDVDEIQRRLKLKGERAATVVLTRKAGLPWMFVCPLVRD